MSFAQSSVVELESIVISNDTQEQAYTEADTQSEFIATEDLENQSATSLDDVLSLSPSATTSGGPRSTSEAPKIRGLGMGKIAVFIDGARQNFRTDHSSMLAIDPEDLKSVEIEKSTSDISKTGSIGGALSLTTKDASDLLAPGESSGAAIKYGYQDSSNENYFNSKVFARQGKSDVLLSYGQRDAKDIELGSGDILPNSAYSDESVLVKANYKFAARKKMQFSFAQFNRVDTVPLNPTLNPPTSADFASLNGTSETTRNAFGVGFSNGQKYQVSANFTEQILDKVRDSDQRKESRVIETLGGNFKAKFQPHKKVNLSSGLEVIRDDLSGERSGGGEISSYPAGNSQEVAVYVDSKIKLHDNLIVSPGLRAQQYQLRSDNKFEKDASVLSKKLAIDIPVKWLNINTTYSEGFNAPKVQDVYADGMHHPGDENLYLAPNYFIPNEDLIHETSKMYEVSLSGNRNLFNEEDLVTFSVGKYWNRVTNYITTEKIERSLFDDPPLGTTEIINVPNVNLWGTEASVSYLFRGFEARATYTQSRGIRKNYDPELNEGYYLDDMPADQYTYSLKYNFMDQGVSIGYLGINTLEQDRTNPYTDSRVEDTDGYFIHNAFVTKAFTSGALEGLRLSSKFDNFTNRRYRKHASHIEEVGLDYKLTVSYTIKQ
jgi:hemoglobin/transferrin/lactoferrin receptor protein